MTSNGDYDLGALGWLLFEQLCAAWLERAIDLDPGWWVGSADRHRYAVLEEGLPAVISDPPLPGPALVVTGWAAEEGPDPEDAVLASLSGAWDAATQGRTKGDPLRSLLVLTNLSAARVRERLRDVAGPAYAHDESLPVHVVGAGGLGKAIDEAPGLRLEQPFVMGVRHDRSVAPADVRSASTLDVEAARELARVYVPSRPYRRALEKLRAHGFCVLTGPPEMGKTAAARVLGLGLMSAGWEVYECTHPDEITRRLRPRARQLFVADDAFGSTEYRPETAERWARALPEILRATDDHHWLIWTSRPTPLKAGLRAIHRERGGERFPAPAEVHVDAADLDPVEKALILFRHARRAELDPRALRMVCRQGTGIVEHRHFTPERIRRFVTTELPGLAERDAEPHEVAQAVERQIGRPTEAMATSYLALSDCQRAVLVAMLDCPAAGVSERDLAAAARRHSPVGLDRAPADLVDRLADHFLRMSTPTGVSWVHPSWRDLVIAQLAGDPVGRREFLSRCGHHGALLALSVAGGAEGTVRFPLLTSDADWDTLGDRLAELVHDADERSLTELMSALSTALEPGRLAWGERGELVSLAGLVLRLAGRTRPAHEPVGVGLLEAWLTLAEELSEAPAPPWLTATWIELLPSEPPDLASPAELTRYEDWLLLAQALKSTRPVRLLRLGFPGDQERIARELAAAVRPLVKREPESPRARRAGRLLLQAVDLLALDELIWSSTVALKARIEAEEIAEDTHIRRRHASAAKEDHALVERVLGDLIPSRHGPVAPP